MGISREAIKIAVELEDDVRRDGDVVVALVNLVQDVPIACDLSLVAIFRICFVGHELA